MTDVFPEMFWGPRNVPTNLWFSSEFLFWSARGVNLPPLVTTGPAAAGTGAAGFIGRMDTAVLYGGNQTLTQMRPGFRIETGMYFGESQTYGASVRYYNLGAAAEEFVGGSDGTTLVNVPQFLPVNGVPTQTGTYVGFPGTSFGAVAVRVHTDFQGGDAVLRRRLWAEDGVQIAGFAGYRFLHLADTLSNVWFVNSAGFIPALTPNTQGEDGYRSRNRFHGLDLGLAAGGRQGCWSFEATARVATGVTVAEMDVTRTRTSAVGSTVVTPALAAQGAANASASVGATTPTPNPNVLTATTYRTAYFGVVPEVGAKVGWYPWNNLRVTAGYTFLYWSDVRRAPEQYVLSPDPGHTSTGMWVQGFNLGVELRY
jgi:hypothetical protein